MLFNLIQFIQCTRYNIDNNSITYTNNIKLYVYMGHIIMSNNISGKQKTKCTPGREAKQDPLELLLVVPTQHILQFPPALYNMIVISGNYSTNI